jgi:hypothetical protein
MVGFLGVHHTTPKQLVERPLALPVATGGDNKREDTMGRRLPGFAVKGREFPGVGSSL